MLAYLDRPEEGEELPDVEAVLAAGVSDGEVVTTRKKPRFAYRAAASRRRRRPAPGGGRGARPRTTPGTAEVALCGIAKRLEEVWLPGEEYPVILPRTSEALYLLQRLRDEAHRFAITHQRRRRKRDISSVLAEVPGLGDTRIKALLRHFGSVSALREATPEQIAELPGIGPKLAATVHAHLSEG